MQGNIMDIVKIVPYNTLDISLDTENQEYLKGVYNYFEYYVKDFRWMKMYQSGKWNGKKSMFKKSSRSLPYGLLTDLIKYTITRWKNEITIEIDDDIKKMFKGFIHEINWDLLYKPHYYQEEVVDSALRNSKGIFKCPTASGKSLIVSYIIRELLIKDYIDQALVIVPTIGLVRQFKDDMIDYYIDPNIIGMVDKDHKEWKKEIVISTWQSLKNNTRELERFDNVTVDEVHGVRGDILHDIMKESNAFWRFGFTGTLPNDPLEALKVKSYIGPVLKSYKSSKLAEEGYIATCNVIRVNISYDTDYKGDFSSVKNDVFVDPFRVSVITSIVRSVDGSILILVDKIEKEGHIIEEHLLKEFPNKQVIFLHGTVEDDIRAEWQKRCENNNDVVIIATFGIFQVGINIKSLKYAVLGSSFKSSIRILQSIGRALRKHKSKEDKGAFIFDINDQVKFLTKHGDERAKYYGIEGFNVVDVDISSKSERIEFKHIIESF